MIGIQDFWASAANNMNGTPEKKDVMDRLRQITTRRNEIVHEADLVKKIKAKKLTLREIERAEAAGAIDWLKDFVAAIDQVILTQRI